MTAKKKKVFVGLSGGVDSAVSAALLKEDGYGVVGVFIKVWQADFLPCTWREERRDAMRAAAHLGIPFLTLDLEKVYKKEVVDYMIREYASGRIPNPDVMCNKHVKFGAFLKFALKHGADYIATGHYARIQRTKLTYRLLKGVDTEKDQSYFLWTLTQKELAHTLFPVGHLQKKDVRKLAKKFGLPNADKKDSQGLCFMGPVDVADFLKHYVKAEEGNVLDLQGNIIGRHDGALVYTIGQRHGFSTTKHSSSETPFFVVAKDMKQNTITVAHREQVGASELRTLHLRAINIAEHIPGNISATGISACARYHGEPLPLKSLSVSGQDATLEFKRPATGIAAGQSLVLYRGDAVFGGGIID